MELIKLTDQQLQTLAKGELSFIEHPTKGVCKVDMQNVFVNIILETLSE
jgi:hypothetical protein